MRYRASNAYFFIAVLGFVLLVSGLIGKVLIDNLSGERTAALHQSIDLNAQSQLENIAELIDSEVSSVTFLSDTPPIQGLFRSMRNGGIDPKDGTSTAQWKDRLSQIFVAYMKTSPEIFQLRYIGVDNEGKELVRVDRLKQVITVIEESNLQAKGERDYFKAAIGLSPSQYYVSPINLNREYGALEYPYRPTIRVAKPIMGDNNELFGFVIANIDIGPILQNMAQKKPVSYYLTDQDDNILAHANPDYRFRFEYADPLLWREVYREHNYQNSGLTELVPFKADDTQLLSKSYPMTLNSDRANPVQLSLHAVVAKAEHEATIHQLANKVWLSVAAIALLVIVIIGLYQRHTRRQHALNIQLTQYESIYQGAMDGIFSINSNLVICDCNASAQDILKEPVRFLVGRKITEVIPSLAKLLDHTHLEALLQNKAAEQLECQLSLDSGEQVMLLVSIFKAYGKEEEALYGVIVKDITEAVSYREKIQQANERLEAEVAQRTKELQAEAQKAIQANESINAFVANISHELRTPINGVMGMLNILEHRELPEDVRKRMNMASRSAENLLSLVNNILDISKIEAGKIELEVIPTDLREDFSYMVNSMSVLMKNKEVQLLLDLSQLEQPFVKVDTTRLKQIISNLLSNAMKFTSEGEVRLTASSRLLDQQTVALEIKVSDTGIGIKSERIATLFEKFTQEDNSTTRRYGGTGLGLAIAKELTELLKGQISVVSSKHQGTTFSLNFNLPLVANRQDSLEKIIEQFRGKSLLLCLHNPALEEIITQQLAVWGMPVTSVDSDHIAEVIAKEGADSEWLLFSDHCSDLDKDTVIPLFKQVFVVVNSASEDPMPGMMKVQLPVTPIALAGAFGQAAGILRDLSPAYSSNERPHHRGANTVPDLQGYTILVVDDNELNLEVAEGLLEDCRPTVIRAFDGRLAIEALQHFDGHVDAILMDCQMPEMDGYTATAEIRSGAAGIEYTSIPIIAMTAGAMQGDRDRCLKAGMDDYLTKPVIKSQLFKKLLMHLPKASKRPALALPSPTMATNSDGAVPSRDLVDFNYAQALSRLGGKESLWQTVAQMFIDSYGEKLEALKESLDAGKSESIHFTAHSLKGLCSSTGLDNAAKICSEIEQNPDSINQCQSLYQSLVESIDKALIQVRQQLKT